LAQREAGDASQKVSGSLESPGERWRRFSLSDAYPRSAMQAQI
ncbi:hypothetical protein A2U01_0096619, partial [Trifolium medium]|nr:hypothetical protein [Trifolium medium]